MKKLLIALSGTIALLLAIVALSPISSALAQGPGGGGGQGDPPMQKDGQNGDRPGPNMGQNDGQNGDRPGPRGGPRVNPIDLLAEELDITPEEVIAELEDGTSIAEFAAANNVDVNTIVDAMVAEIEEHLTTAVENGRLTQAEADERLSTARENITERLQESWQPKQGPRDGDKGPRDGDKGPRGGNPHDAIIAEQLGMTSDELREALQDGETSVADLAADKGVALDTIVDAIVSEIEERLSTAVENGRLTQAEADERLSTARDNITERLQQTCLQPPQRPQSPVAPQEG